ncbi:unnamed protein product, partial [Rotaria socialis]
ARRCREKKEKGGLSEIVKQKDRTRKQLARSNMSSSELTALRLRQHVNLRKFRSKTKTDLTFAATPVSSFSRKQSKSKALNKIMNALPINKNKQCELIQKIAEDLHLLKIDKKYERGQRSVSRNTKNIIHEFYCRDDNSY